MFFAGKSYFPFYCIPLRAPFLFEFAPDWGGGSKVRISRGHGRSSSGTGAKDGVISPEQPGQFTSVEAALCNWVPNA
jgi:hypothetical protein